MWVFFLFFFHHPPSTTLASRLAAVRFGRLVVDGWLMDPISRLHQPPINHALQTPRPGAESAESGPGSLRCLFIAIDLHDHHVPESSEGGTPGLADDAREWLVSPPPPSSVVVLDLWPLIYNMWVFFFLLLHHASLITLASRRAAVRFGLLVIDEPPLSAPSITHQSCPRGPWTRWHTRAGRRLAAVIDDRRRPPPLLSGTIGSFLYNMWVFLFFFLHHPPSTTLASRRTAVRFGRLVVDGPPPLGPSTTPSTMRSRRPDEGRATSTSRPPPALQPLGKTAAAQMMELTHVSPSRWRYLRPVGAPRRWSLHALDA